MHYLANVPGIEHFLAKKCSCPEGGGVTGEGGLGKWTIWQMSQGLTTLKSARACHAGCLYKHHALLLTCYPSAHMLSKGNTEGLHLLI